MIWNILPPLPPAVSETTYFFIIWVTRPFKSVQWKSHMFFNVRRSSAELSGKCMFGLSGLWCGQLRAVVRGSAADDGDDSAAYWPVTPLSAVIAALTDTDHPLSSGQNTFIILSTFLFFFFSTPTSQPEARKIYIQNMQSTRSTSEAKGCYRFAGRPE